jgi:hypothetical protein
MYFDSVKSILQQLEDPQIKNKKKAELKRQLSEIDPNQEIVNYLTGKTTIKPDLLGKIDSIMYE